MKLPPEKDLLKGKMQPKTSNNMDDMEDVWSEMSPKSWFIINPKDLKDFGIAFKEFPIKCDLCGIEIRDQLYEEHLRTCVYNIEFNIEEIDFFYKTLELIKKYIGSKFVISYLNSFSLTFLQNFFWPHINKQGKTLIPIEEITDIITSGLVQQKKDKKFYDNVIQLLTTFFDILKILVSYQGIDPAASFYAASILRLFNKIHEKKYDKYIMNLKTTLDNFISLHEKEIAHCLSIRMRCE